MSVFLDGIRQRNEAMFYFGTVCLTLALIFTFLSLLTHIQVGGVNAWFKPIKFSLSIGIYALTVSWYSGYLGGKWNTGLFNFVTIVTLGFDLGYIAVQAARGEASHFNLSTPMYAALYALMALAAAIATMMTTYMAVIFLSSSDLKLPLHYLWAIRFGLIIFIIFSFQGFVMGSKLKHTIGGEDGGQGMRFFGWSLEFGDGRVAHFFGMHALQIIPLASFYLLKNIWLTLAFALIYGSFATFTLLQALRGRAFLAVP